ncbi:MAG: phosphoribosylformylglycinamidine synthase [Rhodocyclaceae bacterium]|nr:phosphoribosylformylglycinamidine synthase [Rhodocyclaceae bacterium]
MSIILKLRGGPALTPARLARLERSLGLSLRAEHWYFVEATSPFDPQRLERLAALLGAQTDPGIVQEGTLILVTPRLGTISPWASKATDIARNCGFDEIVRIERGIAYHFRDSLSAEARSALASRLHDRMTESVLDTIDAADALFHHVSPQPLARIPVLAHGRAALVAANTALGLALSEEEIDYLLDNYQRLERDPTDVELMMFAQANSEHCRHKIFNAAWVVDGVEEPLSLFQMIRKTHEAHPEGTLVAYADNAAVIEGAVVQRFYPDREGRYGYVEQRTHILAKVETHNHPTAISPFPGAATGAGGEIRDEGATGRGAKPKAGLCGFSVSNLHLPEFAQPWEACHGKPGRIASALEIMIDGPLGAAAFNNEFGRPNLAGYFRSFELEVGAQVRGYHKPIMIAGGIGNIDAACVGKIKFPAGTLLVQLGGPGMLIGLGGGAASSMATGANAAELDYASVQRGNPEMQRRAQEVIDRCWQLGKDNPILAIHDVGAGGLSNAMPELAHDAGRGGWFDLRAIPVEEPGMSPLEIWCNEAQERYVLAIAPERLPEFAALCARERCPFAVLGKATEERRLVVEDAIFHDRPVDLPMEVLLGKPPRMQRIATRLKTSGVALDLAAIDFAEAAYRVLRLPTVANKNFLITIGDRTVGGLTARDQCVGRWQTPVADVAVTTMGFQGYFGECFALGERTPIALLDAPASGRMAIGEALTNLVAAKIEGLSRVKLSANWMAAAGHGSEDAALFDTVKAVALEFCPSLGISIPVGKDSLSMKTRWQENGQDKEVVAPLSLIVTAFAPCADVRQTLTPVLASDEEGETELILIDLGEGRNRLGGSALAYVYGCIGDVPPDADADLLRAFFAAIQTLRPKILAYHDRSDGGLFATICEMSFASHLGVSLHLDTLCYDEWMNDVDGLERAPETLSARAQERLLAALFNEELGAVLQIRRADRGEVMQVLRAHGLGHCSHVIGHLNADDEIRLWRNAKPVFSARRIDLQRAWSEVSYRIARLRDDPDCAQEEFDAILDVDDPGLSVALTFPYPAPMVNGGARPKIAILREQGVNGETEMAAAFDRAGFECVDVHMSDLLAGRCRLEAFKGLAACGGFSYGDVLGAGQGWAKTILFHPELKETFAAFFSRPDTFALGVCNGCQMMAHLSEIIPGAEDWPIFQHNRSERFEARFVMSEIPDSPSIFFTGMAGSRLPVVVSHGEGRAVFAREQRAPIALRYIDHRGQIATRYPDNPNGSPEGIAGVTTRDGRVTIMMPHPERLFRTVQWSWHPAGWGEDSPWLEMFRNARRWVG